MTIGDSGPVSSKCRRRSPKLAGIADSDRTALYYDNDLTTRANQLKRANRRVNVAIKSSPPTNIRSRRAGLAALEGELWRRPRRAARGRNAPPPA